MEFKKSFDNMINIFKSKDSSKIIKAIGNILMIIIYLCVIKVPFIFCRDMCLDYLVKNITNKLFNKLIYLGFEFLYILIIILVGKVLITKIFKPKA